jgi:hypothetical protein
MLSIGIGSLVVAGLEIAFGVVTEFRQSRTSEPVALFPTHPLAVQTALLATLGLFALRRRVGCPWWGCIGLGLLIGAVGIDLINVASRMGRARRAAQRAGR